MKTDLAAISFCGHVLSSPIMNGAGLIKNLDHIRRLVDSPLAVLEYGGMTLPQRDGNSGNTFAIIGDGQGALNSIGLTNGGEEYHRQVLPEAAKICHDQGKPLSANISGFTPEENGILTDICVDTGVDFVTFNTGCPNACVEGARKPVIGFDFDVMPRHLDAICRAVEGSNCKVGVKSTIYSNPLERDRFASLMTQYPVSYIVACNTFPDAYWIEDDQPAITPNNGFAGGSGPMIMPLVLAHVRRYRELLPEMPIIGLGGIRTSRDLDRYLQAGATIGAMTTALYVNERNERGVIYDVLQDLDQIVSAREDPLINA